MFLYICDIVHLGSARITDIDDNNLPVGFAVIEEGHCPKDLDSFDLTSIRDLFTYLTSIEGIVVTRVLSVWVNMRGIFPSLMPSVALSVESWTVGGKKEAMTHSRKGAVVPDVPFIGENIAYEAGFIVLDVLLYRVEFFGPRDLFPLMLVTSPDV